MFPGRLIPFVGAAGLLFGLAWEGGALRARDNTREDRPMAEDIQQAKTRVEEELARLKGGKAKVEVLTEEALARAFPDYLFVSVLYRRFPVALAPPDPLKPSSLYAVPRNPDGKLRLLTDAKGLEAFFRETLGPAREDAQAKDAVRAWLHLASVFVQDGFYQFKLMEDSTKVVADQAGKKASGKMVVMAGGNGEVDVSMTFDAQGRLDRLEEKVRVKPGPRPRCQATKLLDADPVVRAMAEQDLLYLGRAAKDYLDEQRAQAVPELRQAIDRLWQRIVAEDP
jgi:hypothetical protein